MTREDLNFYLQHVPESALSQLCTHIAKTTELTLIQQPTQQTLLVPVHDPINNGQFISGEVLVTSTIVQINGVNGWAMVMDQSEELARAVATLDGAFAAGVCLNEITHLAAAGKKIIEEKQGIKNARVEETRVSFDLM